jgi:hypothetical protein
VRTRGLRVIVGLAAAACVAVVAAPAGNAGLLSCPATGQPFAQWGDVNYYFGFANNGFESGTSGWKASGASVVSGNEPFYVNGAGSSSLSIGPGGTAASPLVCAALLAPDWRMFAQAKGANGALKAQIVFYGLLGNLTGILNVASFSPSGYQSWQPTPDVLSLLALPLGTSYAQLRLTSSATTGSRLVDDVFVDPWLNSNNA